MHNQEDRTLLEDFLDYIKQNMTTSELPYGFPEDVSVDKFLLSPQYHPRPTEAVSTVNIRYPTTGFIG